MPLYEFQCGLCGPFQQWRSFAQYQAPAHCPACGGGAQRVITPPNLYRTQTSYRKARALEERSAHEPEVVVRPPPAASEEPRRPKPVVSRHPWAVGGGH